ncbi:MAG: hypothetical protein ACTSU5_07460 [Promethearchaeota archaeon]
MTRTIAQLRPMHEDPRLPRAWAPFFNHEYITYYSVQPHNWLLELPPVPVAPNPDFGDWPVGPDHRDLYKEVWELVREVPLEDAVDCSVRNGDFPDSPPPGASVEPWKLLFLYSTEPDMSYDLGLDLHKSQRITKGSHGLRHMEFSLFGKKIGRCTDSFEYHLRAAKRAWNAGNEYWAWRFLSRATHYLADLGHPFHIKVIPYRKLFRYLTRPKKLYRVLAATHNSHEVFTQSLFRAGDPDFARALVDGSEEGARGPGDLLGEIRGYKRRAARKLNPIVDAQLKYFGERLVEEYDGMDEDTGEDSTTVTMRAERGAHAVLFGDPNNPGLEIMRATTVELLRDVGRVLGKLYARIRASWKPRPS